MYEVLFYYLNVAPLFGGSNLQKLEINKLMNKFNNRKINNGLNDLRK